MITASVLYAQKSIDALFDKYAGKEGFVTFTISGNLLKLACNNDEENDSPFPAKITEMRILVQEDDSIKVENFYDHVIKDINLNDYEEFMRVKKSDQDLRMLVRSEGHMFREFLLIAGGEDNALIQIKGSMTFKEAKKFSDDAKKNNGVNFLADHK
jgi:translation initiation factor IF-1